MGTWLVVVHVIVIGDDLEVLYPPARGLFRILLRIFVAFATWLMIPRVAPLFKGNRTVYYVLNLLDLSLYFLAVGPPLVAFRLLVAKRHSK